MEDYIFQRGHNTCSSRTLWQSPKKVESMSPDLEVRQVFVNYLNQQCVVKMTLYITTKIKS